MTFDWWTFGLQTVNFVILVWLLNRFLYKPVLRIVDARGIQIEKDRNDARLIRQEAKAELERIQAERSKIETEREALMTAARTDADAHAAARRERAEQDVEALETQARKSLQTERERVKSEIRQVALDLGMDVARRLLEEMPIELRAEAWLDRIEQHLKVMTSEERNALIGAPGDGISLRVISAVTFAERSQGQWKDRLTDALDRRCEIEFTQDPELVAGVELHFPSTILHFSWRAALNAIRAEMSTDAVVN